VCRDLNGLADHSRRPRPGIGRYPRRLELITLRDYPPALALRGIAMAQLGHLARARLLLRWAAAAFGPCEAIAGARCVTAKPRLPLSAPDPGWALKPLMLPIRRFNAMRSRQGGACALIDGPLVLAPLTDEANAHVLALLGDGESCSLELGACVGARGKPADRARAQDALHAADKVHAVGKARARHWIAPPCRDSRQACYSQAALPSG
jgi:hypothetical protein